VQLLTVQQVSDILQVSVWEVYRMAAENRIERVKIGRSVRIPQAALERFIAQNTEEAA
jgi:excisionase family DNA binding protein